MSNGTVKWFDDDKGFGFITPDEAGAQELFVHHTAINGQGYASLVAGAKVSYTAETSKRGPRAADVTPLQPPAPAEAPTGGASTGSRLCCPSCRLRFSPGASASLLCCPTCGRELEELALARDALGYQLVALATSRLDAAVAAAAAAARPPEGPRVM
jgi:cold shock protein